MLRNYLKLALRNLSRQKAFSFINITGLAIGLACSMIILLWVRDELSFDRFHPRVAEIYRLTASAVDLQVAVSPAPVGPALRDEFPEVTDAVRLMPFGNVMIEANDIRFEEKRGFYADSNFFQVFHFPLLQGDAGTALQEPTGIVVTEAFAKKYYGTTDVMGKTFHVINKDDFKVTGVIAAVPHNSHLQFDFILPWAYVATRERDIKENIWDNFNFYTYIGSIIGWKERSWRAWIKRSTRSIEPKSSNCRSIFTCSPSPISIFIPSSWPTYPAMAMRNTSLCLS